MIHNEWVADSKPAPLYEKHYFGGVRLTKSVFYRGMWQTMRYPKDVRYCDLASRHIQLGGSMHDDAGLMPARHHGWISTSDESVVPAGDHKRIATGTVELWCVHNLEMALGACHVHGLTAADGDPVDLAQGEHLLLISGSLSLGSKQFQAIHHLHAQSGPRRLDAVGQVFAFRWTEQKADAS